MISVRALWGCVALVCSVVLAVYAALWLNAPSDYGKMLVGLSIAGPPLVVALLGPGFRIVPLLGAACVAYTAWFCLVGRDHEDIAAQNVLGALRLRPVALAWALAGLLIAFASLSAIRVARRRRARRSEQRRRRGESTP